MSTGSRRAARLAAVQALYQLDMTGQSVTRVLGEFSQHRLGGQDAEGRHDLPDREFFTALIAGVADTRDNLEAAISGALTADWPFDRLDRVVRAILLAGAWELRERDDVPAAVSISEYVDIAKAFYDGKEPGLINGVLDRIARRFRPAEMGEGKNGPPA